MQVESLGLRHAVKQTAKPKTRTKAEKSTNNTLAEIAKVKLVGSLLSLMSVKKTSEYAVLVKGTSWRLALARIPSDVKPGDTVEVVGELVMMNDKPLVKVKRLRQA